MRLRFGSWLRNLPRNWRGRMIILVALAVGAAGAVTAARRSGSPERRQVVLVIVDTLRHDALGCYGRENARTPNIDGIAADGVRFEQAISASGWTLPSVASILTGTWPTVHGGHGKDVRLFPIRDEVSTAAEVLKARGLHTMAFANAAFFSPLLGLNRGFDLFDHHYTYNANYRQADVTVDAALDALAEHWRSRNFILIHLFDPHLDYGAPEPYTYMHTNGRREPAAPLRAATCQFLAGQGSGAVRDPKGVEYVRGIYRGEVSFVDAQIGRFVRRLKSRGMYDETLLIVTADHGEEFYEHDGFEHGHTLYDELVLVPLIVKYPKRFVPARRVVSEQVRLIDVMPTVFDWLGVPKPGTFVGETLTPLVAGAEGSDRPALIEGTLYGADRIAFRDAKHKLIVTFPNEGAPKVELYDCRADPGETTDLSGERPGLTRQLRDRLELSKDRLDDMVRGWSRPARVYLGPEEIDMLRSLGYFR